MGRETGVDGHLHSAHTFISISQLVVDQPSDPCGEPYANAVTQPKKPTVLDSADNQALNSGY